MKWLKLAGGLCLVVLATTTLIAIAAILWPLPLPTPVEVTSTLVIRDVNLVDPVDGLLSVDQDILVQDGQIVAVADHLPDAGQAEIDGRGRYAIPGLFDMHVHSMRLAPSGLPAPRAGSQPAGISEPPFMARPVTRS